MVSVGERLPDPPSRVADIDDDFRSGLSPARWVAHYLPQWTVPERSEAHYGIVGGGLELRIDHDQLDWRPEDAPLRVSNLQTATFSGALGSTRGSHRHRADGLAVRTEMPLRLLFAPSSGRVDVTVSASADDGCMLAAWLVGTEHRDPDESGEICLFEIDADAVGPPTRARSGVKAHHDPRLATDMTEIEVPVDARRPHTWTAIWGDGATTIGCDGRVVRHLRQAPDYPLMLMIDLFEIGPAIGSYPKTATVHAVRAWTGS